MHILVFMWMWIEIAMHQRTQHLDTACKKFRRVTLSLRSSIVSFVLAHGFEKAWSVWKRPTSTFWKGFFIKTYIVVLGFFDLFSILEIGLLEINLTSKQWVHAHFFSIWCLRAVVILGVLALSYNDFTLQGDLDSFFGCCPFNHLMVKGSRNFGCTRLEL